MMVIPSGFRLAKSFPKRCQESYLGTSNPSRRRTGQIILYRVVTNLHTLLSALFSESNQSKDQKYINRIEEPILPFVAGFLINLF